MPITDLGYQVICSHSTSRTEKELIIIIPISDKEEKQLDEGFLQTKRDNQTFNIYSKDIICYGKIDFSTDSDDYCVIENMKWLDYLDTKGISIPSDYDYKDHVCHSHERRVRYTETFNPAVLTQYIHGKLGKPERCCIFKEKINVKRT